MKIKAIFCDLGGVLITVNPEKREEYKTKGITKEISGKVFKYLCTGDRTKEEVDSCLKENGIERVLWDGFTEEVFYSSEKRNTDLYNILEKAKEGGVLIVYTTNHTSDLDAVMDKYQIADLPDLVMNSSEIGVVKPDDKFWEMSLSEATKRIPELMPAEVLAIDDSKTNCVSAIKNGMQAIVYTGNDSDKEILKFLE